MTLFGIDLTDFQTLTYFSPANYNIALEIHSKPYTYRKYYPIIEKKYIDISSYNGMWYFSSEPYNGLYNTYCTIELE